MPRTNMSMYKHWGPRQGWSRRHRTLPTEPGVPSPAGTPVRRSMPSDPEPSPWRRKYFGFVQKKTKKNNTIKKNKIPPSRVIQRPHVMCWHTNGAWGQLGTGHGSHATGGDGLGSAGDTAVPCARDVARWDFAPSAAPPAPAGFAVTPRRRFTNRREVPVQPRVGARPPPRPGGCGTVTSHSLSPAD